MYLVDRIIERCENSSRDWREGAAGGRTLRITQEDYDACGKEELIEEVQRLERAGLLTVKKWVVPDSDVELVAYQVEHLPDFYRLADSESGEEYWPKQAKVNYYIRKIDQELSEGFQKECLDKVGLQLVCLHPLHLFPDGRDLLNVHGVIGQCALI